MTTEPDTASGPSEPLPTLTVQVTTTLVTFEAPTVPLPVATVQVCAGEVGCAKTVTEYGRPLATDVAKVKAPAADTDRLSPPLSRSTSPDPVRPPTVPPMV